MSLPRLPSYGFVALAGLSACTYDSADLGPSIEINTCTLPSDCTDGAECSDGMCVAQSADELTLLLRVTPLRMPDSVPNRPNTSEPLPIMLDRLVVEGPMERTFTLPVPVEVSGVVRKDDVPIEAQIGFTPVIGVSGMPVTTVGAMVSVGSLAAETDYAVQLVPGVEYEMLVQPRDPGLPPYRRRFVAEAGQQINVEYGPLVDAYVQTVTIDAPDEPQLLVRAFDAVTGQLISSTARVEAGEAVLHFAAEPPAFRLEIRADQAYDRAPQTPDPLQALCDSETPVFPVFTVNAAELPPQIDGSLQVVLPDQPERIRFTGTVDLCSEAEMGELASLMLTLQTRSLLLTPEDTKVTASVETTTSASLDPSTRALEFCVEVMPGEYDLIASPPVSMPCALFAERRLVQGPGGMAATGPSLRLPSPAHLVGTLKTGTTPLRGAVVDAIALGRSLELSESESGVSVETSSGGLRLTRYNRSASAMSDGRGSFAVPVDVGSYDVLIKPPSGSGYSWQVRHDVTIGTRVTEFPNPIMLLTPVTVQGTLNFEPVRSSGDQGCESRAQCDPDASLEGAQIDAFAVIDDESGDGERAIAIGTTTADAEGRFTLLVPPSIRRGW